ncbi:MAG TPA: hypothetical protein VI318_02745 [Baekduia sp.]
MAREELTHNRMNAVTADVWRDGDRVHKVLTGRDDRGPAHWASSDDPCAWNSWRREALVYATDLPARLGLAAPRLIDLKDLDGGDVELVLEHVEGRHRDTLTIDDLAATALALGRAQGRPEQPDHPWLSRGFLRGYSTTRAVDWALLHDDDAWARPLMRAHFPPALRRDLLALHAHRERLLALVEHAPRTVAHLDAWPNNIIMRDDGTPVLIDWAFTGDGAVGEDVANLVPDAVFDLFFDHGDLDAIAERATEAYIGGLRDADWRGTEQDVRRAIAACAVKYDWLTVFCLAEAGRAATDIMAYGGDAPVDADARFAARAAGLALCARWAKGALA